MKDNGFSYFLMFYYNQVLGLPGSLAGIAIFIAMMIDAACDPMHRFLVRQHALASRPPPSVHVCRGDAGRARVLLHLEPAGARRSSALFVYLTVLATLVRVFVSAYETPSTAIVAELTEDYDERTRLLSLRYLFGWAGGLDDGVPDVALLDGGVRRHRAHDVSRRTAWSASIAMLVAILLVRRRAAPPDSAPAPTAAAPAFPLRHRSSARSA